MIFSTHLLLFSRSFVLTIDASSVSARACCNRGVGRPGGIDDDEGRWQDILLHPAVIMILYLSITRESATHLLRVYDLAAERVATLFRRYKTVPTPARYGARFT